MKAKEIAFACYAVTDFKKARDFYEKTLNLTPGSVWEGEGMAFAEYYMGPHTLAIGYGAENFKPGNTGATVALEMEDFDQAVKELKEKKVKFVMEPYETSVCWMALVNDPDNNQIMIHQRKQ